MTETETKMLRMIRLMQNIRKDKKPGCYIYRIADTADMSRRDALEVIWSLHRRGLIEISDKKHAVIRPGA